MQCHQCGRARGVEGQRRAFEPEGVGHPPGDHPGERAGQGEPARGPGHLVQARAVVLRHRAEVDPGVAAGEPRRVDPGPFDGLPGDLQREPLLRVHRHRLARRDPEQGRVEAGRVVQETPAPGGDPGGVPAAIGGQRPDGVAATGDEFPQVLRGGDAAGKPARHSDDHHGIGVARRPRFGWSRRGFRRARAQVLDEGGGGRVVEQRGRGQFDPGGARDAAAQLHRGQRVDTERAERDPAAGVDVPPAEHQAEFRGHHRGDIDGRSGRDRVRHAVQPVPLPLEGVGRQARPPAARVEHRPVDRHTADVGGGQRGQQLRDAVSPAAQGGDELVITLQAGRRRHRESGRGAQFQEGGGAERTQRPDGVGEPDSGPHVADPVLHRGHLSGRDLASGHRRDHRQPRCPQGQAAHHLRVLVEHRVGERPVPGDLDVDPLRCPARGLGEPRALRQRARGPGQHHLAHAVDRGDAHQVLAPREQRRGLGLGRADDEHSAARWQRLHQPPPCGDQRARVRQRQHSGDVGGRDLAERVPAHQCGPHAERLDQPVGGHVEGEQRGLDELGAVQRLAVVPEDQVPQPGRAVRADLVEGRREHGERPVQVGAHPGPLGALPGEQRGDLAAGDPPGDHTGRGHALGQRGQSSRHLGADDDRAPLEVRAGRREGETGVRGRSQGFDPGGLLAQGVLGSRRQRPRQHVRNRWLRWADGGRRRLEHQVAVGAAESERRDPGEPGRTGPLGQPGDHSQAPLLEGDQRVGTGVVEAGRQLPVVQAERGLDEPGDAGGPVQVPDVGLHRADQERPGPAFAQCRPERRGLHRVARRGAGSVQLHVVHGARGHAGVPVGRAQQRLLAGRVRRDQAPARGVAVHRTAPQDAVDAVAVAQCVGQRLQHDDPAALTADDAVGAGIEGEAAAARRQHPHPLQREFPLGEQVQGDPAGEREFGFATAHALGGQVHRDQ